MKTIFGNRKTFLSISAIMLALVLMVGGTLAWLVIGDDTGKVVQFGTLAIKSDVFDYSADSDKVISIQPGTLVDKEGVIQNTGTIDAWIEIQRPTIYLQADAKGDPVTPVALTPAAYDYGLYTASYQLIADNTSVENYVMYDLDSILDYDIVFEPYQDAMITTPAAIPPPILFYKTVTAPTRYFLVMPGSGEYYKQKNNGTPGLGNEDLVILTTDTAIFNFEVGIKSILDLKTHAPDMKNNWNGAYMETSGVKAGQNIKEAVMDTFGLTSAEFDNLDWAGDFPSTGVPIVALRGAAKSVLTPYEALQKYYGWE